MPNGVIILTSKQYDRRIRLAASVLEKPPQIRNAIGYSHRLLACAGLPHSDPGDDLPCWVRVNGDLTLTIQQGFTSDNRGGIRAVGYPYGVYPRLILIFLATEAVRTRSAKIVLGRTMADFFQGLGIRPNSRRAPMLRRQLVRLLSAKIQITHETDKVLWGADKSVAEEFRLWWAVSCQSAPADQISYITLNSTLFAELMRRPFPVDLEIVSGIRQSPLAIDLYLFLSYRTFQLYRPTRISITDLSRQLGSNYASKGEFSRECGRALRLLKMFWPRLHYRRVRGAVELFPSTPSVPGLITKISKP